MSDEAFVTLSTNDNYCLGALVLGHSLRDVGTSRKLVILVTPSVSADMRKCLSKVYDLVREVDVMHSNEHKILEVMKRPELGVTLTKLHCWRLTQFKKCVFMDADTLPLKNIDELFERDELSAVCDIGWPDCFNTGIFVFRPSETTFASLCKLASESGSFDGGDQGLLNTYFSDWATSDISKHLSFVYNMSSVSTYSYPAAYQRFGDTVKVVHFLGALKPWMYGFNAMTRKVIPPPVGSQTQQLEHVQKWWSVFINQVQPNLTSDCIGNFTIIDQDCFGKSPPFDYAEHKEKQLIKHDTGTCLLHENIDVDKHFDENNKTKGKSENVDLNNDDEDDYQKKDLEDGLASQLAKLRLDSPHDSHYPGVIGSSVHLDDYSRKRAWESGAIDYMGVDCFENIQRKLDEAIGETSYFIPTEESFDADVPSDETTPSTEQPTTSI
ncbi:glycogenin-1 isoform X1 [Tetranychus urticae]|uniref:glycogenin-1 isoform X1 n=1 Tax=Tetranychus urticae TaxID=32264 RepID=UPI00077B8E73|nr:glycogenin-1 isoform X1 [Tetranychus urticae]